MERTVAIEASGGGLVIFQLSAGTKWYEPFKVIFSDATTFATESSNPTTVGEYSIDSAGIVTVFIGIGQTLAAGSDLFYYYQDPEADPTNKFSIDYSKGILYSFTDLVTTAEIKYKSACYKTAYDISEEIYEYSYNADQNTVSVRTEGLRSINNLVKVVWTEAPVDIRIDELKEFFSPIISVLAFRFT